MGTLTLTYGATALAPIAPMQGTGVSFAAQLAMTSAAAPNAAHSTTTAVDRKADDRVLPRGRRL
jgi:hypothetical protein